MELGNRLRARRQELGLSLREPAERVGLAASFLSQIERIWPAHQAICCCASVAAARLWQA
jgi:DNA-binding XRE family transcriptional regulator